MNTIDRGSASSRLRVRGGSAFTLIELMVVIALIGIVSAMIIPEMRGTYDDALLRSTGRKLIDACNLAYSRAVSLNQIHRLRFDPQGRRFFLEAPMPPPAAKGKYAPIEDLPGSEGELDERVSVAWPPVEAERSSDDQEESPATTNQSKDKEAAPGISFYPDGTADRAEILLRDREGFRLALQISPITARVHLLELPRE